MPADPLVIALEWAGRALKAFDAGAPGQYGPYTIELTDKLRVLRRGPIIDIQWPRGERVRVIGPDVGGSTYYVGRLGWAWQNPGVESISVVPDGCAWKQRSQLFPRGSMKPIIDAYEEAP
jgi:hypothetical protein